MSDFNSQAEVWRYLLEDETNVVILKNKNKIYNMIAVGLYVRDLEDEIPMWYVATSNLLDFEDISKYEVKTWQESINDKPIWCFVSDDTLITWNENPIVIVRYDTRASNFPFRTGRGIGEGFKFAKPATEEEVLEHVYRGEL